MTQCEEPDCREEALIGWGKPPTMLCMTHFDERLKRARHTIDQARQLCDERFKRDGVERRREIPR